MNFAIYPIFVNLTQNLNIFCFGLIHDIVQTLTASIPHCIIPEDNHMNFFLCR